MKKAVITTGGKQYIVAKGDVIDVELIGDAKTLSFEPLLVYEGEKSEVGTPAVKGAKVTAKVLENNLKADKVTSIRFKAKKRVNKKKGHRQHYSKIEITGITTK
jgi:large subunit ribosomal protein L21